MNQNVSIKLSNNVIEALPGDRAEIAVTVTNGNGTVERFEIRVSDIDPTWYQLDWSEMLLYPDEPGNEGTVYLRLSIPPGTPTNSYMPAIEIYSESQQDVVARLPFSLSIVEPQSGGVEIEILPPAQRSSARMGRFQVRLKNGSSRPTSMRLSVRSANPTAQVRIVPPGLELPAMQQAAATLEIRSRDRNLIDRDRLFDFQLSIDNLGLDAGGQFVQTAAWGWLRRILITPFLLFMSIMLPVLVVVAIIAFLWPSAKSPNQTAIAARTAARCAVSDSALVPDIVMDDLNSTIVLTAPDQSRRTAITSADVTKLPGAFTSLISISPDGKQLAYVTADNLAMSNAIIWTTPAVANSKSVRLASVTSGFWPSRPVWSPDSKYLTYVKRTNGQLEMYAINLGETARPQTLLKTPSQLIPEAFYGDNTSGPLCWSRDGSKVIVASTQDTTQSEVSLPDNDLKTFPKPAAEPKTARLTESGQVYAPLAAGDIITPPLPPIGNTDCFVKTFSQNDPRWSDQAIKSKADYNGETLATNGCAIASAAMVLNTFQAGNGTDPGALNGCLAERAVPFNWQANLTDPTCSGGKIAAVERNDFSWAGLDVILGKGQPAIVGLLGGPTGLQFVVAVSGGDGIASTYRVNDPWDGSNYKSLQYFISKGYVPRWLINITPTDTPLCQSRLQSVNKAKPDFKLSATVPEDGKMYNDPSIIFSFQAEGNISTTAKLYTLMSNDPTTDGQAASPVTGQPSVTNFEEVKNGDTLAREGFYQLVIEAVSTDGTTSRLVRYFGLDRTPPTPKPSHSKTTCWTIRP